MIDVLLLAVILAASTAAGLLVLRLLDAMPHAVHGNDPLVLGLATGLGLTSVIGLALAAAGALRPWPIAAAGAVALIAGGRDLTRALTAARLPRRPEVWLLVAVCLLLLLAESPTWFAPPVGGDQTKYRSRTRIYAQAGGLVATPWSFWGAQQWLQNFLFAIAYAVRGENLARLLNATSGVLAALAVAMLVRRHFDRRLGVVAGALFFTMPMCWSLMVRAGADTSLVAYGALAVTAMLDWAGSQRGDDLRRTGLLAGLAGASKVMGLVIPVIVVSASLGPRPPASARPASSPVARVRPARTRGAVPVHVRNVVETGNPIFPFGESIFPGRNWSTAGEAYVNVYYDQYRTREASQRGATPYKGTEVARFPWDLTMHPESFENGKRQGQDVSPFILAFLPALVLLRRRRAAALAVAAMGLGYIVTIAGGAWAHPRYVLPGIALALAAATPAARALCGRHLFAAVVALTVAGNLALISRMLKPMWPDQVRVALGRMKPTTSSRATPTGSCSGAKPTARCRRRGACSCSRRFRIPTTSSGPSCCSAISSRGWWTTGR